MLLSEALRVQRGDIVAFIGAGGKSSALRRLAWELQGQGWRVLVTTTTRVSRQELQGYAHALNLNSLDVPQQLSSLLSTHGMVFLYDRLRSGKASGFPPEMISQLVDLVDSDAILIEADGARRLPLKTPKSHEPVIPLDASLVVPVVGMDVIGQPFDEAHVYNVESAIERYGFPEGTPTQHAWVAQILRDEMLGLQGVPEKARIVPLLNKTGTQVMERMRTRRTAQLILQQPRIEAVAIGRVQRRKNPIFELQRRVGAIVLAGGLSSRMGRSKPLLPWGNKTVIETIVQRLQPLRLADVVVVTGHQAWRVTAALANSGVHTVFNPDFASGEMLSSLQAGLRALDDTISACLVVLGDQPQLSPRLIGEILGAYATGKGSIIAPSYQKRRGHPILIDRRYWRELLELPPGSAPRDLINAYAAEIAYILTQDDAILRDMDTPEQYQMELRRAGLA